MVVEIKRLERENAALREEVEQLKGALALGQQNCDDAYNDLREERDEAKTENVALREDKERLEWIIGKAHYLFFKELGSDLAKGRQQIDAARKETQP